MLGWCRFLVRCHLQVTLQETLKANEIGGVLSIAAIEF
jgi:hypothetical protein